MLCLKSSLTELFAMQRYEQGEVVENELQHMTEQVKSNIQTMNATQVKVTGFSICLVVSFP
jgi:hypothetical protein